MYCFISQFEKSKNLCKNYFFNLKGGNLNTSIPSTLQHYIAILLSCSFPRYLFISCIFIYCSNSLSFWKNSSFKVRFLDDYKLFVNFCQCCFYLDNPFFKQQVALIELWDTNQKIVKFIYNKFIYKIIQSHRESIVIMR